MGIAFVMRFFMFVIIVAVLLSCGSALAGGPTTRQSGRDLQGQVREIPVAERPTVLIFLRPGQKESEREVAQVWQDLLRARQVSVVGVVSGPDARKRAVAIGQWDWPLLCDETFGLSGAFEVHAWPTTIIFDAQGNMAGRIAGQPASLKTSLAAYVAYVTGTMTRGQLDQELARLEIVEDSGDQKAYRHLLMVQQLLASGRVDDAAAQLREARELAPGSESVRLLMARDMLLLGDTSEADAVLATLQGASHPGELALLRGWLAVALGRWQEARDRLLEAGNLSLIPGAMAEAKYWSGIVCEHEGDYSHAAEAFRKAYELGTRSVGDSGQRTTDGR